MSLNNTYAMTPIAKKFRHEPHSQAGILREIILGSQDGLVNVLGLLLGVATATNEIRIILLSGFAALFAESISMMAVAYTSSKAASDHYRSELEREKYDIEIRDYTNQKFNEGLNLDILSVEKDPAIAEPMVKETVEPTILCKGQVVKKAKIILLSN